MDPAARAAAGKRMTEARLRKEKERRENPFVTPVLAVGRSVIILNGDPLKDLSPNVDPNGPRGARMRKLRKIYEWKLAAFRAWEEGGAPYYTQKVRVTFEIRRGRVIDPDNALAGLKYVIDGLTSKRMQRTGMIPDDSAEWVEYAPIVFTTGKVWKDLFAQVIITVEPL